MGFNSKTLPENIRVRMQSRPPEIKTQAEADAVFEARSHRKLQQQVEQYLYLQGVRYIEGPAFGKKTRLNKGAPDIRFCYRGKPFAFEFKVGSDHQSDAQKEVQALMEADGWRYEVVRSLDLVKAILGEVGK